MPKHIKSILIALLLVSGAFVQAQINSVSPYSRFGVGEIGTKVFARSAGMGFSSLGLRQPLNINFSNPASYTQLKLTTFHMGMEASRITQQQRNPDLTVENGRAGLRYLAFGLPLLDWWSSAVSLQPYSFKGYNISSSRFLDSLQIQDNFTGEGGLNVFYWGNAFKVAEGLSLGFNFKYFFGSIEESATVTFDPQLRALVTKVNEVTDATGVAFDFGAQFHHQFENNTELGLGATFTNKSDLNTEVNRHVFTAQDLPGSLQDLPLDSATGTGLVEGTMTLPGELGVGITWGKNHPQIWRQSWAVSLDFEQYLGSQFIPAAGSRATTPLVDGYSVQLGGLVQPRFAFKGLERVDNLLTNTEYRLGAFYTETPLQLGAEQITDYGITFGVGIPVRPRNMAPGQMRVSTLNMGVIAGRRGTLENNLIREDYLQFFLGISISDKWFIKYKYR